MITYSHKGDFRKTFSFLKKAQKLNFSILEKYGELGVKALEEATPKDTGLTAASWKYRIVKNGDGVSIEWYNTNVQMNANGTFGQVIAILIQYGHATRSGTWVEGIDYINPALKPIFNQLAKDLWREVLR